ncbi:MAG: naringenin-chalcone synthase [Deltaproteobacteria bacterium]|nr:naringenin-chalcone synthase [Deltaproteobacteria bacterium]
MYLCGFESLIPDFSLSQEESLEWLAKIHALYEPEKSKTILEKRLSHYAVKPDRISRRFVSSNDMTHHNGEEYETFHRDQIFDQKFKSQLFKERSEAVFRSFYTSRERLPEHLIHVTCTGYVAPSAAQMIVGSLGADTAVTHAYHMGCYAALPSIRMGHALTQVQGATYRVDIVHTELCSLHMDPRDSTPEQVVIQSLFADGFIKYSLQRKEPRGPCFSVLGIEEMLLPDSLQDMRWEQEAWGLRMTLSRTVPTKIVRVLPSFLAKLSIKFGFSVKDLVRNALFAIHPGGPKIIDNIARSLKLADWQTIASRQILFERGNMSSATLPHVWERMLSTGYPNGTPIVSLAFGPGLTIFGAIFQFQSKAGNKEGGP